MDRSYKSSGILCCVKRFNGAAHPRAKPENDVTSGRSDPLIAKRHVDWAPAEVQDPCSRSMDRSYIRTSLK